MLKENDAFPKRIGVPILKIHFSVIKCRELFIESRTMPRDNKLKKCLHLEFLLWMGRCSRTCGIQ